MALQRNDDPTIADEPESQIPDSDFERHEALHERDEQYRVLIDFCPDAIYIHDGKVILFANPAMVELLGATSADDVVGRPVMAHTTEKYRKIVKERHRLILESGMTAGRNEQQYQRRDGSIVDVETQGTPITFNQKPAILVIARNISDQKKTEEMLRDAIDSIPEGFALYDTDDRLVLINDNYFKGREDLRDMVKLGATFEEQARLRESQGVRQKDFQSKVFDIDERIERHKNPRGAFEIQMIDGRALQINEFKTKNGGTAILRTDVSELKNAQEELRQAHDKLERRVEERTRDLEQEIAERKAAEKALKESEKRLTEILMTAADRFWETDKDHRYTFYSPPRGDLNLPSEMLIGKQPWEPTFRDPGSDSWKELKSCFESQQPFREFKYSRTREDGKILFMKTSGGPVHDDDGNFCGYRGTTIDESLAVEANNLERRFFEAMENLSEGYAIWGPDERLIGCNAIYRKIHHDIAESLHNDASLEDFLRARAISGVAARDKMTTDEWVNDRLTHIRKGMEQREFKRDGHCYLVSYSPLEDGSIVVLQSDISALKMATEELRINEQRFKDIASTVADRIWETDKNHVYTYFSEPTERLIRPVEEMVGRIPWKINIRWTDPNSISVMEKLFKSKAPFSNVRFSWTDGENKQVHGVYSAVPVFDENGDFNGYLGTTNDETAEVVAREEVADVNRRFFGAMESLSAGFVLWDENNKFVACNSYFKEMFSGISDSLQPGLKFEEYIRLASKYDITEDIGNDTDEWVAEQVRLHNKQGTIERHFEDGRWFRIHKQRLDDGSILAFYFDITDMRKAELTYKGAMQTAEEASRTKTEFLANMSHELRSPLTAILGYTEAMQEEIFGPIDNDKYKEYLAHVMSSGRHLHDLINDILDVSAIEAGQAELVEESIRLSMIAESAIRIVGPRAKENKVVIVNELVNSPIELTGDERRLKQIFVNLLSNAVKFSPKEGRVEINAERNNHGDLIIKFIDNGIGMDESGIKRALTKFGQVDSALAREQDGTGLGLPLTLGLVHAHGGDLEIDSTLGEGTTVIVKLPKHRLR